MGVGQDGCCGRWDQCAMGGDEEGCANCDAEDPLRVVVCQHNVIRSWQLMGASQRNELGLLAVHCHTGPTCN